MDSDGWFDVASQAVASLLLFFLIFGMSATVDTGQLRKQAHNKFAIATGVCCQFVVMPFLGFAAVKLLNGHGLSEPMAVSLLIVTASPGGSFSNWWCSLFNADLALSVTMTAVSTVLSTVMLPLNLLLYANAAFDAGSGEEGEGSLILHTIEWPHLFVSLAIVIVAIALGLCASAKVSSSRFSKTCNKMGSVSGVLLIVFSALLSTLSGSSDAHVWAQPWTFYASVTAPCLLGLAAATCCGLGARLKRPEVVTVAVECCYQNVGIATTAAVAMFDDPVERGQALCVPLFYGTMEAVVLGLYCVMAWKLGWTKAPRDANLCVALVTTYEVGEEAVEGALAGGPTTANGDARQPYPSLGSADSSEVLLGDEVDDRDVE